MTSPHQFHIPVMGLAFTIDSPIKVARFGIDSVLSIVEDKLIEQMRAFYCKEWNLPYTYISEHEDDSRAKRITAYLNLVDYIVTAQSKKLQSEPFAAGSEINKYFELLPDSSPLKQSFLQLSNMSPSERTIAENELRNNITAGSIDVNIMTKVDKPKLDKDGNDMGIEQSDALAALRGFANSNLHSSVVFSAGLNPRLYGYCESFTDFFPDSEGYIKKKIILEVSDYRSALIQGKFLAKKGLWVSEFRLESGLNCGGHAFATDGLLMGPILAEFKTNRETLYNTLFDMCETVLQTNGKFGFNQKPALAITAQGGIGTAEENKFLLEEYQLDRTGWGSPFLLVPEATNVDTQTLHDLATAKQEEYYLSHASPLGVPFNNFRKSSSEIQRKARITNGKPGSPCLKKFLQFDTEFTKTPICTASTKYQYFKLKQLKAAGLSDEQYKAESEIILEKDCLCEGLSAPALLVNNIQENLFNAVTICPGPNLAYFSGVHTLSKMVDHIYGRANLLNAIPRSNLFINELRLYVDYWMNENKKRAEQTMQKKDTYLTKFKDNLLLGINYYKELLEKKESLFTEMFKSMFGELVLVEQILKAQLIITE